jgi:Mrp family chromosome partitioning ATPase
VRYGKTTRDQLRHAIERLNAVDAKTLGLVFNMVPPKRAGSSAYAYTYQYDYASKPERKDDKGKSSRGRKRDDGDGPIPLRRAE